MSKRVSKEVSRYMSDLAKKRKTIGGFTDKSLAKEASLKGVEARKKKRENADKDSSGSEAEDDPI